MRNITKIQDPEMPKQLAYKNHNYDLCLTFNELKWFVEDSTNKDERTKIIEHISICQLCAMAVEGFAISPFTKEQLNKLNTEIDLKSKPPMKWNSLLFSQVSIVMVLLFTIIGFYVITTSDKENKINKPAEYAVKLTSVKKVTKHPFKIISESKTEKTKPDFLLKKQVARNIFKTPVIPVESLNGISVSLNELIKNDAEEIKGKSIKNDGIVFIDGFKVADYQKLYINKSFELLDFTDYTPAFLESKKIEKYFNNKEEQKISLIKELKKGLHFCKKQKYEEAITAFQFLLDNDGSDINALFYMGLSCYETKRYALAENYFRKVLLNANTNFYQEAKWKLANSLLKAGKREEAKKNVGRNKK